MPAPASVDEFLDLVQKSGVADPIKFNPYIQQLRTSDQMPSEPSKLAGMLVRDALITYFQAEQILQGKWKRFSIGKYKVLERLGSGGMGQVFLCEHKLMRRRVAVKVLPTAKAADPSSLARFYREARAVAALDHPNIVRAFDIDQDENLHFLVMEFVDGTNLQDLVKKFGKLDILRACHYIYGSAVGLQYAFEMGIVHRDIKPANILVDRSGVVKILDMGLARFFHDEDDQLTKKYDENVLGTADYLAPEQAVESHTVDIRADLYSLGGTFYYLLSGQPPFPEGSVAQKLLWHQTREPKPIQQLRPELPDELAAILTKMMSKDPNARYATPADLLTVLAPHVQVPIPPPPEREMPQFSPAAVGGSAASTSRANVSGVLMMGGSTGTGIAPALQNTPTPGAATPPQNTGIQAATPPGAVEATNGVWETLAKETDTNRPADTGSAKKQVSQAEGASKFQPRTTATPASRKTKLVIVGLVVLALATIGIGYALFQAFLSPAPVGSGQVPPEGQPTTRTWYVSRSGDSPAPDATVSNLHAAIQKAGPGDTILVMDEEIQDPPVMISSGVKMRDVTIAAGNPSQRVRWTPQASGNVASAVEIVSQEGFMLKGFTLVLDGQFDYGLTLRGYAPGMAIENVTIESPRQAGVRLSVSAAAPRADMPARPLRLHKMQVTSAAAYDAAIFLTGDARLSNRSIQLTESLFTGPADAGVRITGQVQDFEISQCRFHDFETGIQIAGPWSDRQANSLVVRSNTFHALKLAGIAWEADWPPLDQRCVIERNLWVEVPALAVSPSGKVPGLQAQGNGRDAKSKEGKVALKATQVPVTGLSLNRDNLASFLRYERGSPLATAGPDRQPLGAPPE